MVKCEYFGNCGTPETYECEHDGKMSKNSLETYCSKKTSLDIERSSNIEYDPDELKGELEKAAEETDEEIESLQEAARPTNKTLRIEFGDLC